MDRDPKLYFSFCPFFPSSPCHSIPVFHELLLLSLTLPFINAIVFPHSPCFKISLFFWLHLLLLLCLSCSSTTLTFISTSFIFSSRFVFVNEGGQFFRCHFACLHLEQFKTSFFFQIVRVFDSWLFSI